ncbi:MAG: cytochrome P450 [Sulfitobacter sp.]
MLEISVPVTDVDPFESDVILNSLDIMRRELEPAPILWLEKYGVYVTGRYDITQAMLKDWKNFTSTVKAFGNRDFIRPLMVQEDPPDHSAHRNEMMKMFSPVALRDYEEYFNQQAEIMADEIVAKGEVEAIADIASRFVLKVFPDILGVSETMDRQMLLPWGELSFNSTVPGSRLYKENLERAGHTIQWFQDEMRRENVNPDKMIGQIYKLGDEGRLTPEEAAVMVIVVFSAGFDTSVLAIGNGLKYLAEHPDQWDMIRENPRLVRTAFEETIRMDPPSRLLGRGVNEDMEFHGVQLKKGDKIATFLGVANRDPAAWEDPDTFKVDRKRVMGHTSFGVGIHACAGQALARMEFAAIVGALAKRVKRIELTGECTRKLNNQACGWDRVPLKLHPA